MPTSKNGLMIKITKGTMSIKIVVKIIGRVMNMANRTNIDVAFLILCSIENIDKAINIKWLGHKFGMDIEQSHFYFQPLSRSARD